MTFWRSLALVGFAILAAAAVWMGALNQDEGWYLYAAQMVAEGKMPYRDFFYTQGPLMPIVYSAFVWVWRAFGLLGARLLTLAFGAVGIVVSVVLARRLVPVKFKAAAGVTVLLLLGSNLYHLYYLAIPKTYAIASLLVAFGFYCYDLAVDGIRRPRLMYALSGFILALAAGARISLGALLAVVGVAILVRRHWFSAAIFALGGAIGLAIVYGPFLLDDSARSGLIAAQQYHASRGGFDLVWVVGSVSRLVRWYCPLWVALGFALLAGWRPFGCCHGVPGVLLVGFLAVFAVQMLAPFPYDDYQVPIMGILAVAAAVGFIGGADGNAEVTSRQLWLKVALVLGMVWCGSFGSPLLERWSTNGQDRFWSLKKSAYELPQLREVARRIEALDPGGKDILTQDLYLAIETRRRVPCGLEMGPFAMLSDAQWRELISSAPCKIAATSGYTFAIDPPVCNERDTKTQVAYWQLLKSKYQLIDMERNFGQNSTTLLIMEKKD